GLGRDHLLMLAEKLFGKGGGWPEPPGADGASGFSFWAWLDGILGLLQEHLKQLWKDGLILGFVSRKQEKKLLKGKRTGTFLIRFSESVLGGVTCTWVEHPTSGPPAFRAVVPYTAAELASLALPDIIRDYQLLVEENIPENPLQFLYPDTPRDEAFGPYYSQRQDGMARHGTGTGTGTLPPELRDLEPLPGSPDVQELLQSLVEGLEPGAGTLETLEAADLMPDILEDTDGGLEGLGPGLPGECWGRGWGTEASPRH
uniref:SH2 domain-containing protein n=1 Tax=Strix occidentalis caurina TaxID=311401 RepID=A0A8D0FWK5_STROC